MPLISGFLSENSSRARWDEKWQLMNYDHLALTLYSFNSQCIIGDSDLVASYIYVDNLSAELSSLED